MSSKKKAGDRGVRAFSDQIAHLLIRTIIGFLKSLAHKTWGPNLQFCCLLSLILSQVGRSAATAVKKQSSDWSSSGWDADDSWSNEKEGPGQSSAGEDGWGNDWGEDDPDAALPLPDGVRLASDYNWDGGAAKGANQNDLFASLSQRNTPGNLVSQWRGGSGRLTGSEISTSGSDGGWDLSLVWF